MVTIDFSKHYPFFAELIFYLVGGRSQISTSGPIVAFVLAGKTGSGKSSFIKLLGGKDISTGQDPIVSGALDSCKCHPVQL